MSGRNLASGASTRPRIDPAALACALLAAVAAAVFSTVVFGRIPHVQDSITQLFQARIFAGFRLWAPSPPFREFFDYTHMINDGRWYCQYPPGHSLLLVPGVWLGVPWLVNPILGGFSVYGIFLLGRDLFGRSAGRLAALLGLLSPFLLLMASEFMAHVSCLAALTYFLVFFLRAVHGGGVREGRVAGLCLLLAVLIRPYTAAAVALPAYAYAALRLRRNRGGLRPVAWTALGGALGVLLLGLYNWGTTGNPLVSGYIQLYGPAHGIGFGKGLWGPPHTPARGLQHTGQTLRALNEGLFRWPLSSLWPLVLMLVPARKLELRARTPAETVGSTALLFAVPLSLLLAYLFYWYHDLCFGPRYLYEALGPILALSAAGLLRLGALLGRVGRARDRDRPRPWPLAVLLAALFAVALAAGWPKLFRPPTELSGAEPGSGPRMASYFRYYSRNYWGVGPTLGETVARTVREPSVVLVRLLEPDVDLPQVRYLWFGSAFAHMPPDFLRGRVIYARDQGERNRDLASSFPARAIYLYDGSIERGTLRLLRGPLAR